MDELTNLKLHRQEVALREVIARFARLHHRANGLGSGPRWFGPASRAYDAGVDALLTELGAAHQRLTDALHDTSSAVVANAGPSCGG